MACDYFIDALNDPDFALKVRERSPKNLDSALRIALQLKYGLQTFTEVDRIVLRRTEKLENWPEPKTSRKDETTELLKKQVAEIQRQLTDLQRGNQAEVLCNPKTEDQPIASSQDRPKTVAETT